ncbi:MAG: hypothetical protein LWX83_19045 [Anaerolineae bacterium]|nr:hypothetical protein [Anaerolineae bacterium]
MRIKGYVVSGLIGMIIGIAVTSWATRALPKIISRSVLKTMNGMMERMERVAGDEE